MKGARSITHPYKYIAQKYYIQSMLVLVWTDLETKSDDKPRMASYVPTDGSTIELPSTSSRNARVDNEHQQLQRIVIVTVGKTGVGKSTLLNNFLQLEGDTAFKARKGPKPVTEKVAHSVKEINGVQVRVIDMPGLHAPDSEHKFVDIGDLKGITTYDDTAKGVDVVFYCVNLNDRLQNADYDCLDTLMKAFGLKIWEHVIFVFTHTDETVQDGSSTEELVGEFIKIIHEYLVAKWENHVQIRSIYSFSADAAFEDFNGIVGIPVSKDPAIPEEWRTTLLLQVIRKCRKENIRVVLKLYNIVWDEVPSEFANSAGGLALQALGSLVGGTAGGMLGGTFSQGRNLPAVCGAAIGSCYVYNEVGLHGIERYL